MKRLTKLSLLVIAVILVITATVGITISYNTKEETGVNVVTMGDLKIATVQTAIPKGESEPKPFAGGYKMLPSTTHSWILEVENRGSEDAYVRVVVDKKITLKDKTKTPDLNLMSFNYNNTEWTYKDGYFYYNTALKAGEKTKPLFTEVSFDKSAGNIYQSAEADAEIYASATQVKNNGTGVMTAQGWPEAK